VIATAEIDKEHIFLKLEGSKESEVIVDPSKLRQKSASPFPPAEPSALAKLLEGEENIVCRLRIIVDYQRRLGSED
jgi:hypothetical protein